MHLCLKLLCQTVLHIYAILHILQIFDLQVYLVLSFFLLLLFVIFDLYSLSILKDTVEVFLLFAFES